MAEINVREILRNAPKVELHVHLDGAFDTAALLRLANIEDLPETVHAKHDDKVLHVREAVRACGDNFRQFEALVTSGAEPRGLMAVLDCFCFFLPMVRGRNHVIEELAYEFCRRQASDNIIYTQVRYSPHEFVPQDEDGNLVDPAAVRNVMDAICRGLERGQADFSIIVRQVLCCINRRPEWSESVAELAKEFCDRGIVGVDVASGECHFQDESLMRHHSDALRKARAAGFGVTVHTSEVGPAENVRIAVEEYGASCLGHGYRAVDTEWHQYAREKHLHFEVCPTSSISCQSVVLGPAGWKGHPLVRLLQEGTSCSINTDDPAVFRVTLTEELVTCVEQIGLTLRHVEWMTLEAIKHAFKLAPETRASLEATVTDYYKRSAG